MSMNAAEIKSTARQEVIAMLLPTLQENNAKKFGDASFAVPREVDGQKLWVEVMVRTKQYKDTKVSPAFDPDEAARAWQAEKEIKAANAEMKKAEHEKKVSAARTKREAK